MSVQFSRYFGAIWPSPTYRTVKVKKRKLKPKIFQKNKAIFPKQERWLWTNVKLDTRADFWPLIAARDNVLNAGADINGFVPVTFEELVENNRRFKEASKAIE